MTGASSVIVNNTFLNLTPMGRGVGMISSWDHSASLDKVLDRNDKFRLFTSMAMFPFVSLEIFSPKDTSRSAPREANAWVGFSKLSLSIRILRMLSLASKSILSDQLFPDCPNLNKQGYSYKVSPKKLSFIGQFQIL